MKKTLIALSTVTLLTTSAPSHALVGLVTANPVVAKAGLVIGLGGPAASLAAAVLYGKFSKADSDSKGAALMMSAFITVPLVAIGIVLLDGENGQEVKFHQLTKDEALKLKLSEAEEFAYNSNTEELAEAFNKIAKKLNDKSPVEDAKKLWDLERSVLGNDAINALAKVMLQTK